MVRRPKRKKRPSRRRSSGMIALYIVSVLVVVSMVFSLAVSLISRRTPTPTPSAEFTTALMLLC